MPAELINKKIEEILRMSPEEVKDALPLALDEIGKYGIEKTLEEVPDLLSKIMKKLIEVDAAKLLSEAPEVSNKFMDLLWEGVNVLTVKSKELISELESERLISVLEKTGQINVNIEASDSPLTAHFTISRGKISGGSGLLHFKDQDFRFHGPTQILIRLLNDELALGYSNPELMTDGHPGFAPFVSPIVRSISKLIKGKQ
ncbi:MAG: hypothetical protein ACE5LA_06795 [Dehalococcoidales bacterium]